MIDRWVTLNHRDLQAEMRNHSFGQSRILRLSDEVSAHAAPRTRLGEVYANHNTVVLELAIR